QSTSVCAVEKHFWTRHFPQSTLKNIHQFAIILFQLKLCASSHVKFNFFYRHCPNSCLIRHQNFQLVDRCTFIFEALPESCKFDPVVKIARLSNLLEQLPSIEYLSATLKKEEIDEEFAKPDYNCSCRKPRDYEFDHRVKKCIEKNVPDPCASCYRFGTEKCVSNGTDFQCICSSNYVGRFCRVPVNPCTMFIKKELTFMTKQMSNKGPITHIEIKNVYIKLVSSYNSDSCCSGEMTIVT
ncbi:hypothetical protein Ciccas_012301, partial [Cichlidogyrus casuarinus]